MNRNEIIAQKISSAITWISIAFFFVLPLFMLPITTEFNEYNKLVLLIGTTSVMLVLWIVSFLLRKKVVVSRTPFDIPLVLLLAAFLISTWYSVSRYTSIFGSFNSWHWTAVEMFSLIVLFYVIVTNVDEMKKVWLMVISFVSSVFVVAIVAILGYFNVFDSLFSNTTNTFLGTLTVDGFSPAGAVNSTIVLFLVALFFAIILLFNEIKAKNTIALGTLGLVTGVIGVALVLWLGYYIPGIPSQGATPIQPAFTTSWRIASSAIRDYPWFGTGLSTYSTAYNAYRSAGINGTDYWNVIFDRSGSEYMTLLTTAGVIGLIAFATFVLRVVFAARKVLAVSPASDAISRVKYPAALAVVSLLVIYLFVSSTVLTSILLFMMLALWMSVEKLQSGSGELVEEVELSFSAITGKNKEGSHSQLLPWIVSIPVLAISITILFFTVQDFRSNVAYATSLRLIAQNAPASEIYNAQGKAINLNGYRDAYHRGYAETNISFANAIAQVRGEELTDTDRSDILTLIDEAIRQVRVTTELLNPVSAANWQVRANVYRNLLGVATGADQWALESYLNAINLAPSDPRLYVDLGGLYLTLALSTPEEGTTGEAPGENVPATPTTREDNLARAESVLLNAINLKSDYANAHYNLAAVYNAAERYDLAKTELETVLRLVANEGPEHDRAQQDLDVVNTRLSETTQQ
ncbi:hypothetical protein GW793_03350 [bacterium]|uniref:O-antigen ligase-related domain-containing protein n=1 Tax=candidate division WWE3 bacterium CG22_combo_CG10-13_8_21_14_all_39_12 TaxID=1975094 RepID=A0A2H0BGX4_UNCKA|nr:hypothetical protein [bacterium]PIP56932.1 MAG: hypothetical protein COX05_00350 [candidate division WWE3 bacterium CG22_combo_CG10-13_8_21_14_all_39_12]